MYKVYHKVQITCAYTCTVYLCKVHIFGYRRTSGHPKPLFYVQDQLSSVQNLCWLMIIVDCTTQYIGDHNNTIEGSLKTNQ